MRCHNCGEMLEEGMENCPNCGYKFEIERKKVKETNSEIEEFELPVLKNGEEIIELDDTDSNLSDNDFEVELKETEEDENFDKFDEIIDNKELEISLEKTRSISPIDDNEELNNISFMDDISKQIDAINEEANEDKNSIDENVNIEEISSLKNEREEKNDSLEEIDILASDDSLKKRKRIFVITGIVSLMLVIIIGIGLYFGSRIDKKIIGDNYIEKLTEALQKYYDTKDIDDVIYILEDVKKDPEKIKKVQAKTRTTCDSWLLLYFDEKVNTRQEFDEVSEKYKELLNGLHNYALIKNDDRRIKALTDTDYDELLKQVNDIYSDSTMFFDALALFDSKDYNKAYYNFDRIEKENKYYEKAISYKNKIINNILDIMQKDINKIENGMDNLEDKEKLQKYSQIESIIFEYNNVYSIVKLSDNENYQKMLSIYTSKVSEYTDKVLNSNKEDNINNNENENLNDNIENEDNESENIVIE